MMKMLYCTILVHLLLSLASAQKIVDVDNKLIFYTNSTDAKVNEFTMYNFKYTENVSFDWFGSDWLTIGYRMRRT